MTALEDFENTLKEVVNAKRLSASKMNRLTEIAMKSLEDDTQLVAILYRTHKSLPDSAKVHSLYAFDALARAARSQVSKRGITGDLTSEKGNAATFLLKMEGVLDGLFQDMTATDSSEAKEKTKKVLDIWAKSNTFPSTVLTRLRDMVTDVQKDNVVNGTPNPRVLEAPANVTTPPPTAQSTTPPDVQSTLLTLLGQAAQLTGKNQTANVDHSQIPPNTEPVQLGQAQLALLQQLALTAKLGNGTQAQTGSPVTPALPPAGPRLITNQMPDSSHSSVPPSGTGPPSHNQPGYNQENPRHERVDYPHRPRDRSNFHDERYAPRGGFRGGYRGGYRGRGRDRWDDRYNSDHFRQRDRDWDAPSRPRRSRSRSPRRHEGRRDARPQSPPHRSPEKYKPRSELPTPALESGKDEFGRDIRPSSVSPPRSMSVDEVPAQTPVVSSVVCAPAAAQDYHIPVSDQLPSVAASTSAQSTETHTPSPTTSQQQGLDQFSIATFDATEPSSWEALGNMWQTTYGYPPSQEELMQFVMTSTMAAAGPANNQFGEQQGDQWQQAGWEGQGSRGNGGRRGGRGGYTNGGRGGHIGNGNYRDGEGYANTDPFHSDAVVLGEGGDGLDGQSGSKGYSSGQNDNHTPDTAGRQNSGAGGRMQRVGDKWVFVREPAS